MRNYILSLFCLLASYSYAAPYTVEEPIGRRFGMSLIEVIDNVIKEGIFHYTGYTVQKQPAFTLTGVSFADEGRHYLNYAFKDDKCVRATVILPIEELSSVVNSFDKQYTNTGRQKWRSSYAQITVTAATGKESIRSDGKPHVLIEYDLAE